METNPDLIGTLAHWLAAGKLEARVVLPALERLAGGGEPSPSLFRALEAVGGQRDGVLGVLGAHLRETLRKEALRVHASRHQSPPVGSSVLLEGLSLEIAEAWSFTGKPEAAVEEAIRLVRDLSFVAAHQAEAPGLFREIKGRASKALADAHAALTGPLERSPWGRLKELETAWDGGWRYAPGDQGGDKPFAPLVEIEQCWLAARKGWIQQWGGCLRSRPLTQTGETQAMPAELDNEALLSALKSQWAVASREEKARLLDGACAWITPDVVPTLREMTAAEDADLERDRAMLNLTLRFGEATLTTWGSWQHWLSRQAALWEAEQEALGRLIAIRPEALRLIFYAQGPDPDPAVLEVLAARVLLGEPPLEASALVERWARQTTNEERRALLGSPAPSSVPLPPVIASSRPATPEPRVTRPPALREPAPAPPPAIPPQPSLWQTHVQPFFAENWYMVAGIVMVIFGSSLLAYFTWDKHWLLRYTIMPSLLGLFTWSLAGAGGWIERRGAEFRGTAAVLRGAAIALLPINFMATAILSSDPNVPQKVPALLALALIYVSVFGWGLRRWCSAVEPALGNPLAGALLLLNAIVVVGPLAKTLCHLEGESLLVCIGTGFYLGFAVAAATIVRFTRRILTRPMAEEKRVPWFVAASLGITFVQVFLWVHGFMRHVPEAQTYALLVILIGWLVLFAERRALELKENPQWHGGESFLGFALLLLGVLMGFSQPTMRIVVLGAAGGVWLYQARSRKHPLHYWIALTLWALGGASVTLLPAYPGPWLPLVGVVMALGFGIAHRVYGRRDADLGAACRGLQAVVLILTTMVTPLAQWHYDSPPLPTAGWLTVLAAILGWQALKDQQLRWLHGTLVILALALPYAGFMDVAGRTAHHNTMVFGLAVLAWVWLGVTRWKPIPLILQARSTGLWLYGILGVAAMVLRVLLGDTTLAEGWYHDGMDYAGPILMMLALVPATYYSRSLVPAGMAVAIMAILFPELRGALERAVPWLGWGSGLGSAGWGLALVWLAFRLRPWTFLKDLPEGDRYLGQELFPLRRHDHTLFTWPILVAALFLITKVDTWNLVQNELAGGIQIKTALALGIAGVAWTFLAIYHREQRGAVAAVHLGWLSMLAGLGFGYWHQVADPCWTWPFLMLGLCLQGLYWLYRFQIEPARPWAGTLLTEPTRAVLLAGSAVLSLVCMVALIAGADFVRMQWLYGFLAAQLVWHALAKRHPLFASLLFFHGWIALLAFSAPGVDPLWTRVSATHGLSQTLWWLVGIQALVIGLEAAAWARARAGGGSAPFAFPGGDPPSPPGASLVLPVFALASGLAVLLGLTGLGDGLHGLACSPWQQALLLGALVLTARNQACTLLFLPAVLLGYELIHRGPLSTAGSLEQGMDLLLTPWHLGLLGLSLTLLTQAGYLAYQSRRGLVSGPFAQPFFRARSRGWLFWPATIFASVAAARQTFDPVLRDSAVQLWAPYLGAATFALIAWFWGRRLFFAGTGALLFAANIHLVRVLAGPWLRAHGLSELHLICLGAGLTLIQATGLRRLLRDAPALTVINRACLGLAALVLALLTVNYITAPDVAEIQTARFLVSGALAWLAGRYFRRAARQPEPGEESHGDLCEALYHFGVVLAIWCAALLVPWFRQPLFTLIAIALPLAYFYGRAEWDTRSGLATARRYRNSAAVLGFVVLGLYVFKAVLQAVMFPNAALSTDYYHYNAPLLVLLALMLLRLHGLGGTGWLAFYGGLALMTGGYFLLTALPGFSPFHYPMPAAWCALALGHFWILVSYARSPLRTFIQRLARLDDPRWHSLRHYWGLFLLAATQGVTWLGIADYASDPYQVAPLLAGAATIILHQGWIRRSAIYLIIAGTEFALALHAGFLIPSYLPKDAVIWALLGLWLALLAVAEAQPGKAEPASMAQPPVATDATWWTPRPETIGRIALVLAMLVFAHIGYHRPWSTTGLWGMALGALLAAWNPMRERQARNPVEAAGAAALLAVPVWLTYFSQAPFDSGAFEPERQYWPILAAAAVLFLIGAFARVFPLYWAACYFARPRAQFRLFDVTLAWLESNGARIHRAVLWIVLGVIGVVQVLHYQQALTTREFTVITLLEAALAAAWFYEGRDRPSMLTFYLMQVAAFACGATIRRHLMLTTAFWRYEYDVWASLGVSFALAGAKQVLDTQPRALRVPLLTTLLVVPALALAWVIFRGLGVDLALMVVGLHAVLFSYLGKDDRESPYNLLALGGFVGFVLITFYSKLHFQAVHAYIIPVGLGVLILQHLFQQRIPAETRNWIRLVTLMAMLGSAAYYALADDRHAITFNLTLILLGLLAMGLGSLLRVRLYLALGFAGLTVDLVSLLYKMLVNMERSARMTIVGSLVLLLGAAVVFGAIYYKTNKPAIDAWLNQWRRRFHAWE